jgi:hypothetical protein
MDVISSFNDDLYEQQEVLLDEEEMNDLSDYLNEYVETVTTERERRMRTPPTQNEIDAIRDESWKSIAVHAFMAGRAYQSDRPLVLSVPLRFPDEVIDYIHFLAEKEKE